MNAWCPYCDAEREGDENRYCVVCGTELEMDSCCVSGHAEIRFNGDDCPLCDTLRCIEAVLMASEDGGKMSDIDWNDLRATMKQVKSPSKEAHIPGLLDCPSCGDPGHPKSDDGTWVQVACRNPGCDQGDLYRVSSKAINAVADSEG